MLGLGTDIEIQREMKTLPCRNANLIKFLKSHHQEQVENILQKNQLEIDIVEDIRSFVKQKCNLDKTYAEALLKLSTNFQSRKLAEVISVAGSSVAERKAGNQGRRRVSLSSENILEGRI